MMQKYNQDKTPQNQNNLSHCTFFITCASGFEDTLSDELQELYETYDVPAHVSPGSAGCLVRGPFACGILANLASFCASRVLLVVLETFVRSQDDLEHKVAQLPWTTYFDVHKTFAVKSNLSNTFLNNSMFLSLKVKDVLCDQFVETLKQRPNVDTKHPDVTVHVRLVQNQLSVSLDMSGDPLFQRGYKKNSTQAPLKETLAASLLRLSGWNHVVNHMYSSSKPVYFDRTQSAEPGKIPKQVLLAPFFLDSFCGSGTIALEAALTLLKKNPNTEREHFSFENFFPQHEKEIQKITVELKQKVLAARVSEQEARKAIEAYAKENQLDFNKQGNNFFPIYASDIDAKTVAVAKENAQHAGVENLIHFSTLPAEQAKPHASCGLICVNPPYGERLGESANLLSLYKSLGDSWKHSFPNWTAWLLSSNQDLSKSVGLRATRKFSVYNGNLECRFLQFVMYAKKG